MGETYASRFSRPIILFLVGVPLLWALLLLFHPMGEADTIYLNLRDEVTRMLVVHIGMLLFLPLLAVAVLVLLRGVEGTAAWVGRVGVVVFVVLYGAYEVLQGIATSVLVNEVKGSSELGSEAKAALVQDFAEHPLVRDLGVFGALGTLGLIAALIAAGVALHRHAGAPVSAAVLLGLSGFMITAHPPPFGPIGLVFFAAAVVILVRSRPEVRAAPSLARPKPA
jgi:hypothetical protein